jgi:hypothetical protein
MKTLIIILMLVSSEAMAWGENTSQYKFDECEAVNQNIRLSRCENKEAVCYIYHSSGGISCNFKSK